MSHKTNKYQYFLENRNNYSLMFHFLVRHLTMWFFKGVDTLMTLKQKTDCMCLWYTCCLYILHPAHLILQDSAFFVDFKEGFQTTVTPSPPLMICYVPINSDCTNKLNIYILQPCVGHGESVDLVFRVFYQISDLCLRRCRSQHIGCNSSCKGPRWGRNQLQDHLREWGRKLCHRQPKRLDTCSRLT